MIGNKVVAVILGGSAEPTYPHSPPEKPLVKPADDFDYEIR